MKVSDKPPSHLLAPFKEILSKIEEVPLHSNALQASAAVSLKRIADALEVIAAKLMTEEFDKPC